MSETKKQKWKVNVQFVWRVLRLLIYLIVAVPMWVIIITLIFITEGFSCLLFQYSIVGKWLDMDTQYETEYQPFTGTYEGGDVIWQDFDSDKKDE